MKEETTERATGRRARRERFVTLEKTLSIEEERSSFTKG